MTLFSWTKYAGLTSHCCSRCSEVVSGRWVGWGVHDACQPLSTVGAVKAGGG